MEPGHVTQKVESDPEQREATQADAQWQQEFPEQITVEEAHRTRQPYAGSIRLTNCGLQDFHGAAGAFLLAWSSGSFTFERMKQAVFLTTKTTSMVCWLFVGSALFSAVFAILGGQQIIESWVLGMNLSPLQFMLLSQALIFVLGWPLEWTEIIVIFVPIFLPMLSHFNIDPILWGTLVFVNLQAAFLSPPVAMSAFYLKGVAPPHVTLNQIFAGMMPYMFIVIICMAIMYAWPGMALWLPKYLYGGG